MRQKKRIKYILSYGILTLCFSNVAFADTNVSNWVDLKTAIESATSATLDADIVSENTINNAIASNVTVNGLLHSINGSGSYLIFNNAGTLTVNNANLLNGKSALGGAVYNAPGSVLNISNVNFGSRTGSGTTEDPYVYTGGNTATPTGSYQGGGAIYNKNGTVNIFGNTNFFGNTITTTSSDTGGGAIANYNNASTGAALININSSGGDIIFDNNKVSQYWRNGGAIYNYINYQPLNSPMNCPDPV